jgi:hypothetical protein
MKNRLLKSIISCVFLVVITSSIQASDWATGEGSCFSKSSKEVSVGLSMFDFGFYAAYDMGFHDAISGGIVTGYNGYSDSWFSYGEVPILVRAAFHPFNLVALKDKISVRDKLDVYVGPSMGYEIGWVSWKDGSVAGLNLGTYGGFIFREYIGVRYFFTPKIAVTAEDCAGLGVINIGICFKF